MIICETISALRQLLSACRQKQQSIAFVPTMGNLHQGHMDLVERARQQADIVVVSIFVNPLQFGPSEDLDAYPRTMQADIEKLEALAVEYLFAPERAEVYGKDEERTTRVIVPDLPDRWCGESRPGHFDGVSTVVNKLFNIVQPDIAVFGEKDFQQLAIIRKMVTDLNMPIAIESVATRREADGLAMSSRNGYLTANEREIAPKLQQTLLKMQQKVLNGVSDFQELCDQTTKELDQAGFETDYVGICRQQDLNPATAEDNELVILAAAKLGAARLIDNLAFSRA